MKAGLLLITLFCYAACLSLKANAAGKLSAGDYYNKYASDKDAGMTVEEFQTYLYENTIYDTFKLTQDDKEKAKTLTKKLAHEAFGREAIQPSGRLNKETFSSLLTYYPALSYSENPPAPASSNTKEQAPPSIEKVNDSWKMLLSGSDKNLSITHAAPAQGQTTTIPGGSDPGPAQFNWTHAAGSKAIVAVDAAISYKFTKRFTSDQQNPGEELRLDEVSFVPSFEAHVSNDSKNKQDSLKAKADIQFLSESNGGDWIHGLSIAPNYQRDRIKTTETYGADIFYTPQSKWIPGSYGIQPLRFWQVAKIPTATEAVDDLCPGFAFLPSVGFENGYASTADKSTYGPDSTFSRFATKINFDLYLVSSFDFKVTYTHRIFLTGDHKSFDFVELEPIWYIGASAFDSANDAKKCKVAVGLDFTYGNDSPTFKHVDSITGFVGIKY